MPTLSKEQAIVWLKMISRLCSLLIISAVALQLGDMGIAIVTIIGQLAVERLSLFSDDVTDRAKSQPSYEQRGREQMLLEQLTALEQENQLLRDRQGLAAEDRQETTQ